jgi:hypothetical protein
MYNHYIQLTPDIMWEIKKEIDYSIYYGNPIRITYIKGYDETNKLIDRGVLTHISKNIQNITNIRFNKNITHPKSHYLYKANYNIDSNLISKIEVCIPNIIDRTKVELNHNFCDDVTSIVLGFVDEYIEI